LSRILKFQNYSLIAGRLPIERSPWIMDGGLVVGLMEF
jgi:hypothetical protein